MKIWEPFAEIDLIDPPIDVLDPAVPSYHRWVEILAAQEDLDVENTPRDQTFRIVSGTRVIEIEIPSGEDDLRFNGGADSL